ncbi:unnamed protein product [Durusdinium trenchii]|uniref:Uncharacterized protein n=1 Tax=Durusdinium trenchii TaxID=1381693 RepID=A0ABP0NSA2_9DINO
MEAASSSSSSSARPPATSTGTPGASAGARRQNPVLSEQQIHMLKQDPWLNKDIEALGPLSRSGGWDGNRWDLGGAACLGAKTVGFQRTHVFFFFKLGIQ